MALGAMEGVVAAGKSPGKDVFIGGLNWDPPALDKVKDGALVTTVGGHFMIGGWALVLLYDYERPRLCRGSGATPTAILWRTPQR